MSRERERKEGNAYQSESRKKRKVEGRSQSRSLSPESKAKEKEILERGLIMKEETKKLKEILDLKTKQEAKEAEEEEERRRKMEADLVVVTPKKRNSTESLRHNPSHVSQYKNSLSEKVGDDSEEESDDDIEILRRGGSARVLAPSIGVKALPPSMMVSSENKRTNLDEAEQTKAKVPEPLYAKEDFEPEPRGLGSKPAQKQEQKKARVSNSHQPQQLPPTPSDPKATILSCGVCQTDALNIYVDDEHFTEPSHQRAMLTMGEMISDLFLGNKNLRKLIDKTLLKEEERKQKAEAEVEKRKAEEAKRGELNDLMKEPGPDIEVIKEEEPEIKVIDPRKSPFLPPTSCLVVAFDVKLTDACWASEIYQLGARCVNSQYSTYILPHGRLNWDVSE